ncbi:hypothetical protein ONE63_003048 [Megalurothrips usitatus]|uniref:Uncharacterized protein n=1 Tax=Megalurothrips usitatus TaxID=439358 RepID=A0AAV7X9K5_9NEOP|nr:hypothetical protein ONE63_003048 [Megalurothrips usitatus]
MGVRVGAARVAPLALLTLLLVLGAAGASSAASRHRRYLHFPFGSTLRVAVSTKWATVFDTKSTPPIWTQGINWGITYDLPNGTQIYGPSGLGPAGAAGRRGRRDLYRRVQTAIDSTGFLGESCLLRAICEAPQALPVGSNVFAELLRVVLWDEDVGEPGTPPYALAHRSGRDRHDCADIYRDCPVSVLGLLLSLRPANKQ